ncbi:MAG TPA: hypothetical protein VGX50_12735 [Longimicrobium sp.]|nr:hypothetical protein [Longimicrobium sp.]
MSTRPTPPLAPEGIAEIVAEMQCPPQDTSERRGTFDRARSAARLVHQIINRIAAVAWDREFEEDVAAGRLDALADEALTDLRAERTRPL